MHTLKDGEGRAFRYQISHRLDKILSSEQTNGIVALCGSDNVVPRLISALKSLSHRAWYGYKIITEDTSSYDILEFDEIKSNIAIGCCLAKSNDDKKKAFHGTVYHPRSFNYSKMSKEISKKGLDRILKLFSQLDGDFTFAIIKENQLIYGRDPLGVKPLYFARNSNTVSIATEMKALKVIGFNNIKRVRPGSIHISSIRSEESFLFNEIIPKYPMKADMDEASDIILDNLSESIKRRIKGLDSVVLAFSGGLDSSLLASIISKLKKVILLSIYVKSSKDEEDIKKSARSLGLELEEFQIDINQVRKKIGFVRHLIENGRAMDLAIGLGVYFAAEKCSQIGQNTMFLGQYADELFGGYAKYIKALRDRGEEFAEKIILQEVFDAHKNNFERDEKSSSPYVELRLPYANIDLVKYAISLPLSLKIGKSENHRKLVLKEVAMKAGLPKDILLKRKKAFQYSSGLQKLVNVIKD